MSRVIHLILTAIVLVILVAACSGATGGPGVATLDDPEASGSPTPAPSQLSPQDAALAYARCMRENGVDMPDPQVSTSGGGGEVRIDQQGGPPVSKDKFTAADAVCRHFMAAAAPNGQGPQMSAEDQDKVLAFAKCMREHGVDMPDPDFSSGGFSIQINGSGDGNATTGKGPQDDPEFKAAEDACKSLLPGKLGEPGSITNDGNGPAASAVNQ
jgi:hypothetical protein